MKENSEVKKGTEIEHEHDETIKRIAADAKAGKLKPLSFYTKMLSEDHTEEIKDYYTRLIKMEKEAKGEDKDDRKEDEGLHDEEVDKAFEGWTKLGEKWGGPVVADEGKEEEHFPEISLTMPSGKEFKVGDEIEAEFKCCVRSVSKDKKGMRVSLELKEAKFD